MILKNIKNKKKGEVSILTIGLLSTMIIIMIGVISWYYYYLSVRIEGVHDDLTYSNLATYKNIDMDAIASNINNIRIDDSTGTMDIFEQYLEKNMNLDSNLNGLKGSLADGQVTVDELTFYNVYNNDIKILSYNNDTKNFVASEITDSQDNPVKTSNGKIVTKTSVYSTIEFNVDLLFNVKKKIKISVCTDITR